MTPGRSERRELAAQRQQRIHELASRPTGVCMAEVVDRLGYANHCSAAGALANAAATYQLIRVKRPGTRAVHYFANREHAHAFATRPDRGRNPAAASAPTRVVPPRDRNPMHVPLPPGWGGPPVRRAGADDWRRCGNVLLGRHRPGAAA